MHCACAILSSLACPALQYLFSNYALNGLIFEKTLLNIKVCEGRTDQRNAQIKFSLINLLFLLQWLVTCKDFRLPEDGFNWVAETCRSNLNNNKLINEKLICAFRWSILPSIMKMHGPKNKIKVCFYFLYKYVWNISYSRKK